MEDMKRVRYVAAGRVQGVGFRPFVYRLALEAGLAGTVKNGPEGVTCEVQGMPELVDAFGRALADEAPPLAEVASVTAEELPPDPALADFQIVHSEGGGAGHAVLISPDTATCADCLAELFDPTDARHLYPFINCTNCGPRYTITRSIPYDRPHTSMACFPLCPACQREYENPLDRRFHAQPNACPDCGPEAWLTDASGAELARGRLALAGLAAALSDGKLAAVKGLGGFHLACDAANARAVTELRRRKRRPAKPLAVMVPDLAAARSLAEVGAHEAALLEGMERPIVLCPMRRDSALASDVSPDTSYVGLMLPYTPLHHVLLHHCSERLKDAPTPPALVMTSGNLSDEPICLGNREALARLGKVADLFLLHNRDILIRTDDSVVRPHPDTGQTMFLRRARGYTPAPIALPDMDGDGQEPHVLALGPQLKNTVCLAKDGRGFVSQHTGDMENLETYGFHKEITAHLEDVLQADPEIVVHDLHPDYLSTRQALELAAERGLPALAVQHHQAHAMAVAAENRHAEALVALCLDGAGYGGDGTIWGGECLYLDPASLERERLAHCSHVRLPGGEAAIREPWRMAQAYLYELGVLEPAGKPWPWLVGQAKASAMVRQMLDRDLNCPVTSSCGRLFDAVAAMLGLAESVSYEGQAAIRLEEAQDWSLQPPCQGGSEPGYACGLLTDRQPAVLDTLGLFAAVHADWEAGEDPAVIARRFHLGLVAGLAELAAAFAACLGVTHVGLSGGCLHNLTLSVLLPKALQAQGLTPLVHTLLPPGDGCVSLGQAAWGRAALRLRAMGRELPELSDPSHRGARGHDCFLTDI